MNRQREHQVWRQGVAQPDWLAEEIPIAFEYNGISQAVMLATPADLEDFALGFSLSEGLVPSRQDIFGIDVVEAAAGITLQIEIASAAFAGLKERRRSLAGRTGCGLCGVESLAAVMRPLAPLAAADEDSGLFPRAALYQGVAQLPAQQALQKATGASHAACCVHRDGRISHVREDIGRHNALDKTLGALARDDIPLHQLALIITSRASLEMVQKAAALGCRTLAAVSAPTAGAARLANQLGIDLIGFLRQQNCVEYSNPVLEHRDDGR